MKFNTGYGLPLLLAVTVSLGNLPGYAEFEANPAASPTGVTGGTYQNTSGHGPVFTNHGANSGSTTDGTIHLHADSIKLDVRVDGASTQSGHDVFVANGGQITNQTVNGIPVNSVQNAGIIHGGTYYNTPGFRTEFTNTQGGNLWLQSGANLRGKEVDTNGALTNNGGTVYLHAPGSVVRLDGNIDVRAAQNGQGAFLGNGGRVWVDAAYLFQDGNIYADGVNGGLVQFNVGSAVIADNARIQAKGLGGNGGVIDIRATGAVSVGRQAVLDTSGKVAGTFDSNIINIEGGAVQIGGFLTANGVDSQGGTIRIVATGQTDLSATQTAINNAHASGVLTSTEANGFNTELSALKNNANGDIVLAANPADGSHANIWANGFSGKPVNLADSGNASAQSPDRAGDGGTVVLLARHNIENQGWIQANGGQGNPRILTADGVGVNGGHAGTVSLNADANIHNTGRITVDGGFGGSDPTRTQGANGGNGGLAAFSYGQQMLNDGVISAKGGAGAALANNLFLGGDGGQGGLVVFSGHSNLSGNGAVVTFGGPGGSGGVQGVLGTVVAPYPATSTNTIMGVWRKTQPGEMLTHGSNLLLLTLSQQSHTPFENLNTLMMGAQIRSVDDSANLLGNARNEVLAKGVPGSVRSYWNQIFVNQQPL